MKSKTKKILAHLLTGKSITQVEAFYWFNTTRLASIIFELRKKHPIETITIKTKDGSYAKYKII